MSVKYTRMITTESGDVYDFGVEHDSAFIAEQTYTHETLTQAINDAYSYAAATYDMTYENMTNVSYLLDAYTYLTDFNITINTQYQSQFTTVGDEITYLDANYEEIVNRLDRTDSNVEYAKNLSEQNSADIQALDDGLNVVVTRIGDVEDAIYNETDGINRRIENLIYDNNQEHTAIRADIATLNDNKLSRIAEDDDTDGAKNRMETNINMNSYSLLDLSNIKNENTDLTIDSNVSLSNGRDLTVLSSTYTFNLKVNNNEEVVNDLTVHHDLRVEHNVIEGHDTTAVGEYSHVEGIESHTEGNYSHAEGNGTNANGDNSHAEGRLTQANGACSHAEGNGTIADGDYSHAEGLITKAYNSNEHAEGMYNVSNTGKVYEKVYDEDSDRYYYQETSETDTSLQTLHSIGTGSKTITPHGQYITRYKNGLELLRNGQLYLEHVGGFDGDNSYEATSVNEILQKCFDGGDPDTTGATYATTLGYWDSQEEQLVGMYSHAEGLTTQASGEASHAEGKDTQSIGNYSHAEGWQTIAEGYYSHAEGEHTNASGDNAHAEGYHTEAQGYVAHAEGYKTEASSDYAHAEGVRTLATDGLGAHSEGYHTEAHGYGAHSEGYHTEAHWYGAHAEGVKTRSLNDASHAEGCRTESSGYYSHAEGCGTESSGYYSHAEGVGTRSSNEASHAEGSYVEASAEYSHAEGLTTRASGAASHTEGFNTHAQGNYSHAEGQSTKVTDTGGHVEGIGTTTDSLIKVRKLTSEEKTDIYNKLGINFNYIAVTYDGNNPIEDNCVGDIYSDSEYENRIAEITISFYVDLNVHSTLVGDVFNTNPKLSIVNENNTIDLYYRRVTSASGKSGESNGVHVEGYGTQTIYGSIDTANIGNNRGAHAEGMNTVAASRATHAEGSNTGAYGRDAHAEGQHTLAYGGQSHAEGMCSISIGAKSHAEGEYTLAKGEASHAEGYATQAVERYSHAEGESTKANKPTSHAEGYLTLADDYYTHAEGWNTTASRRAAHSEGTSTYAYGLSSHAEGLSTYKMLNRTLTDIHIRKLTSDEQIAIKNKYGKIYNYIAQEESSVNMEDGTHGWTITYDNVSTTITSSMYVHVNNGAIDGDAFNIEYVPSQWDNIPNTYVQASATYPPTEYGFAGGQFSHVEGYDTIAGDDAAHAEGDRTKATNEGAHAEGSKTESSGKAAHAEGHKTVASGDYSHAEGVETYARTTYTHAEGYLTEASGKYEGRNIEYFAAHAEGNSTYATAKGTHAEGSFTHATAPDAHAEGRSTEATGIHSHAEGSSTKADGTCSHAEGSSTTAENYTAHAEGWVTHAKAEWSHAEGNHTIAKGQGSHSEGYRTTAEGNYSHAECSYTTASGDNAHAEGYHTEAQGYVAHAEGLTTRASGEASHAEGCRTEASAEYAHTEGLTTRASGEASHTEGIDTQSIGNYSHAEGHRTVAYGEASHAAGWHTYADNKGMTAVGIRNATGITNALFVVGDGKDGSSFHNVLEVVGQGDSNNTGYLNINGQYIKLNGAPVYQSSDSRLKNVIPDSDIDLAKAYEMIDMGQRIISIYTLKDDPTNKKQIGLDAQKVQEFFPEIVYTDNMGYLTLDYCKITVILLRVMKEIIDRIKVLENNDIRFDNIITTGKINDYITNDDTYNGVGDTYDNTITDDIINDDTGSN